MFEENTGAGIKNDSGQQALYDLLESKCPCYHRLDALFRDKANVTSLFEFDHSRPGMDLAALLSNEEVNGVGTSVLAEEDKNEENESLGPLPSRNDISGMLVPLLLGE